MREMEGKNGFVIFSSFVDCLRFGDRLISLGECRCEMVVAHLSWFRVPRSRKEDSPPFNDARSGRLFGAFESPFEPDLNHSSTGGLDSYGFSMAGEINLFFIQGYV